jgi:thiamine-phosphate pyrophosphorylase
MTAPRLYGLYVITDPKFSPKNTLREKVEQAILGGARLVQYRDKGDDARRREGEVSVLLDLCRRHGVPLIVNDDVGLALKTGAHGIHIGRDDTSPLEARKHLGDQAIIGASCYADVDLALRAQEQGANYIAFGSFFTSPTKPNATRADVALLTEGKRKLTIPICAIGGITARNSKPLIDAGADILAVVTDVFAAANTRAAAQRFSNHFT